ARGPHMRSHDRPTRRTPPAARAPSRRGRDDRESRTARAGAASPPAGVPFPPAHDAARPLALLDRHSDEAAPLGPGAVVVADPLVTQQVTQHEPGVRAALADAAIGDRFRSAAQPFALIDRLQLIFAP